MEKETKTPSRLEAWFTKPYQKRGTWLLFYAALALAICAVWVYFGMDNDSYYMIPQGKGILADGIPSHNQFTWHGAKIVVQQWLYCAGMYLADSLAGNTGLMLFMLAQALLLFHVLERYLNRPVGDPFWSCLAAAGIVSITCLRYYASLRPENITLVLVIAQCAALDRWRETKRKRWLAALPAVMLAEANLHISMWPIHACVYAAYLVPALFPWLQSKLGADRKLGRGICPGCLQDDGLRPDPWLYGATALSFLALLANPYGWDGIMYLPRSMKVFGIVSVTEQLPPNLLSETTAMVAVLAVAVWMLARRNAIGATEACLALGFGFMATINYHNSMFLVPACAAAVRPAFRLLSGKKPARAADLMPNGVKSILAAGLAVCAMATAAVTVPGLPGYKAKPDMDPAIGYILSEQAAGKTGNVLNNINAGPMLEYAGATRLFGDTRPELLLDTVAGTDANSAEVLAWLCTGVASKDVAGRYEDPGQYMDANGVDYVMDTPSVPVMVYLHGWLTASPDWQLVEFPAAVEHEESSGEAAYGIWIRKGAPGA